MPSWVVEGEVLSLGLSPLGAVVSVFPVLVTLLIS